MLVLSRKVNEDIIITVGGVTIRMTVIELRNSEHGDKKVRLGFTAPPQVSIHRGEIQEMIEKGYK